MNFLYPSFLIRKKGFNTQFFIKKLPIEAYNNQQASSLYQINISYENFKETFQKIKTDTKVKR